MTGSSCSELPLILLVGVAAADADIVDKLKPFSLAMSLICSGQKFCLSTCFTVHVSWPGVHVTMIHVCALTCDQNYVLVQTSLLTAGFPFLDTGRHEDPA